jgi:5-methylcytosine-specific restriction endonuclease McrA
MGWKTKYNKYMRSPAWYDKRKLVIERCGNVCEMCKKAEVKHVHHLTYERLFNESLADLQGLCVPCHQKCHPDKKIGKKKRKRKKK